MRLKVSSAKRRPFCLSLNVLINSTTSSHEPMLHYCQLGFLEWSKKWIKMIIRLAFNKIHWKISSQYQPFCLGPNMFIILIWLPYTKTAVTTLVIHWSYCSLALSHWLNLMGINDIASEVDFSEVLVLARGVQHIQIIICTRMLGCVLH